VSFLTPRSWRLATALLLSVPLLLVDVTAPVSVAAVDHATKIRAQHVTRAVAGSEVFALPQPATTVAAYWRGNPHAHVALAFSADGVHFGRAQAAGRDEIGAERANGTTYGALHSTAGAVAVRVSTDRPIAHLTVLGLSDGTSRVTRTVRTPSAATAATDQPAVVSRGGWGADESLMTWTPQFYPTKKLIVHHTDTSNDYVDQAGAEAQIRSIYYYHSVTQDWGDIGYNFLIDKFGTIYEGRYSRDYAGASPSGDDAAGNGVTGAHTSGWNSGTVGVALLGTLTTSDATPAARDALERLLAWEANRHGIDPLASDTFVNPVSGATITTPNIAGHRDYAATACPGDTFYPTLPALRTAVAARINGGTADTQPPTTPAGLAWSAGRTSVTLSWKPSTDNQGVTGYEVWRSKSSTSGWTRVGTPSSTTFTSGSLARRTTYWFKVRAADAAGNLSAFSTAVKTHTS
jgi:hypothetical protein